MKGKWHIEDDLPQRPSSRDVRTKKASPEIDMNPMVDMAFLLLTFFMLSTTFSRPQAMELVMPAKPKTEQQAKEQPVKESKALTIILGDDNLVFWYRGITDPELQQTDYAPSGLRKLLLDLNRELDEPVVLIKPQDESTYENLVDVLDEMRITSTQRYAIVDIGPEEIELVTRFKVGPS